MQSLCIRWEAEAAVQNRLYSLKKSFLARFFAHSTEEEKEKDGV